jgi:hypothetical protein
MARRRNRPAADAQKDQTPFTTEARRLRRLERFRKTQQLFDRDRLMRQLRDARSQADAIENYLSNLNPAYRRAAEDEAQRARLVELIPLAFRGRAIKELLLQDPESHANLRPYLIRPRIARD